MSEPTPEHKSESRLALLRQRMEILQPAGTTVPDATDTKEAPQSHMPPTTETSAKQLTLPPGPIVKRKKSKKLTFAQMHTTISLSIDNRIAKDFKDFLEKGETKTAIANRVALKILIEAGYPIDEHILQTPFPGSE